MIRPAHSPTRLERILCALGFHSWHYMSVWQPVQRHCNRCPKEQKIDGNGNWRDVL